MTNQNEAAFPGLPPRMGFDRNGEPFALGTEGLTKREYFAAHAPEVSALRREAAEELIGEKFPGGEVGSIEASVRWSSKVDARLRVIYADALIEATR